MSPRKGTDKVEKGMFTLDQMWAAVAEALHARYPDQDFKIIFTKDQSHDIIVTDVDVCLWADPEGKQGSVFDLVKGRTYTIRIAGPTVVTDDGDPMMPIHWDGKIAYVNCAYVQPVRRSGKKVVRKDGKKK